MQIFEKVRDLELSRLFKDHVGSSMQRLHLKAFLCTP